MWGAFSDRGQNTFYCSLFFDLFLLHLALNGLQVRKEAWREGENRLALFASNLTFPPPSLPPSKINFVNYSQYKFGWNVAQSSASLCLIFVFTALFPRLLLPLFGIRRAIQLCSCLFALGFTTLGLATKTPHVLLSLILIAAGSVSLPATLALLTNQAPASEKGSINGAADTVRTLSSAIGFPLMTGVFAYFISDKAPFPLPGAALFLGAAVSVLALLSLQVALWYHDHHDKSV